MAKIKAKIGDQEHEFECPESYTILEAAIENNINPPFSCMSGSCSVCAAKLVSGEMEKGDLSALDQAEIDSGLLLTCQAYPRSEEVAIEYQG